MKISQVAAQLYTIRDHLKTPKEIARSLQKVRHIGFEAVQVAGMGPVDEKELAGMLKGEGLGCCGSHEDGEMLLSNPAAVVERLGRLGCRTATYPWPGGIQVDTLAEVKSFAAALNRCGEVLRRAGLNFCYHNHHIEFHRAGGRLVLEIIYGETNPDFLKAEIDTYWVQFGGGDPVDWCRRMSGRLLHLHMKDFGIDNKNNIVFAEVGSGNLNWNNIVAEAESSGCRWFIIEQDTCPGDPFDSLATSFRFVREKLVKA